MKKKINLALIVLSFGFCPVDAQKCGALVAPDVWREFMCHNLGATNINADPLTPSWEIIGGYWQWGRIPIAAEGPNGGESSKDKAGRPFIWDGSYIVKGAWVDSEKTSDDPCPAGFRVPTQWDWAAVITQNKIVKIGTWSSRSTNYSSGVLFGDNLMLPASGFRDSSTGELSYRGYFGTYWSSTRSGQITSWNLFFDQKTEKIMKRNTPEGCSIRCIAE